MNLRFWRRRDQDAELEEELRGHLRMAIKNRIERGESPERAEAAARREFGNLGLVREVTRETWGWASLERLIQDLRYAGRVLVKSRGFTAIAVLTLALGIGANTAIFSVLNLYLFRPLPFPESGRLVQVYRTSAFSQSWPHSPADLLDLKEKNSVFESMAALNWARPTLVEGTLPAEALHGLDVTADFFPVLQVQPETGRVFTADEDRPGANLVAVLSDRFWRARFAADPGILGRKLLLDGKSVEVIGVMPPSFEQPLLFNNTDVWRPLALSVKERQERSRHYLWAIARLKPGVSQLQAQESMITLSANITRANVSSSSGQATDAEIVESVRLQSLQSSMSDNIWRSVVWFTFGLAAFVLLIACANLANLQLVRTAARTREHAIRAALGAGRFRLLRQSLTESLLVSLLGGALSIVFAKVGVDFISNRLFAQMKGAQQLPVDFRVFGFALVCSVLTGLIFGTIPAWLASRADVNRGLKENLRGSSSSSHHRLRHALIVGEVAFALALLTGAGLFLRGLRRFAEQDPNWKVDGLLTAEFVVQGSQYESADTLERFYGRLEDRLSQLPGVQRVSFSQSQPVNGFNSSGGIVVEGQPEPPSGIYPESFFESVSSRYFETMGVRLVAGRAFTSDDRADRPQVIIINDAMARRFWPNENAIGKRVCRPGPERQWWEVVGVVNDVGFPARLDEPYTRLQIFQPAAQALIAPGWTAIIELRTSTTPEAMTNSLRYAVAELDPTLPVNQIRTARSLVDEKLGNFSLLGTLLADFACLGLILAAIGIYGVISYSVTQRTGEIGVRMALGARTSNVLWLVMGKGTRLILTGALLGLCGGFAVSRFLISAIPNLPTRDPVAMVLISLILVAVAMVSCYLPARRATQVDPMEALRCE
jgi:putative ABC transport system permease protein